MSSVYDSTNLFSSNNHVLTLHFRWSSKIFDLPMFFRGTSLSRCPLKLFFQFFTNVLIKLLGIFQWKLFNSRRSSKYWRMLSNFCFPILWNLLLILLKSTVSFYLVCRRTQFVMSFVVSFVTEVTFVIVYIFIILRSIVFLKIAQKLLFVHFAARLSNQIDKWYEDICVENLEVC